jgi:SAM-dependent methyltransferase
MRNVGKILDVGCGNGGLLSFLNSKGWQVFGVEPSAAGYQIAINKIGSNIYNCALKECGFADDFFDIVVLNHVLEHITNPVDTLVEIRRVLKSSGSLYVAVPNIESYQYRYSKENWYHFDPVRHVHQYSDKTLTAMLKQCGLTPVKVTHELSSFPFDLFRSFSAKLFSSHSKIFKVTFSLPLLTFSWILRLFPKWRGTVEVTAIRCSGNNC